MVRGRMSAMKRALEVIFKTEGILATKIGCGACAFWLGV